MLQPQLWGAGVPHCSPGPAGNTGSWGNSGCKEGAHPRTVLQIQGFTSLESRGVNWSGRVWSIPSQPFLHPALAFWILALHFLSPHTCPGRLKWQDKCTEQKFRETHSEKGCEPRAGRANQVLNVSAEVFNFYLFMRQMITHTYPCFYKFERVIKLSCRLWQNKKPLNLCCKEAQQAA